MKRLAIVVLCCYASLFNPVCAGPVSLKPNQVETLRELVVKDPEAGNLYGQLRKTANAALNDAPHPVEVVIGEGKLDSDPGKIRSDAALKDMPKITALSWVWLVSGDSKYAAKGEDFISAWAKVNKSDGDPINESSFERLIVGYDILRPQFSGENRAAVDAWLREKAVMLWNDPRHHTENWQSHRLKIVGLIATLLQDDKLWKAVENGFAKQISSSFLPNGESTDFQLRDAMHYHLYSVLPLLTLSCVARQRNHDWYEYEATSGASLKRAMDFIAPYALREKSHVEFAHSKVKFDMARARAGEGEYAAHEWNTCTAGPVYSEASCVDPDAEGLAIKTWCGVPHKRFVDWESVLGSIKLQN
ncbi:alginate lyase family protein [Burkholderia diffusa]|uniref:alginate lyase family protein n=1 Tax=Burkholderia diffusa TaxID=488732 RepID=UPI00158A5EA6|nr:alginate lyase family protein [Burkholderia diffusa]